MFPMPPKAGIVNLTRALANDLAQYGINVNCISPGLIVTDPIGLCLNKREINRNILKRPAEKALHSRMLRKRWFFYPPKVQIL